MPCLSRRAHMQAHTSKLEPLERLSLRDQRLDTPNSSTSPHRRWPSRCRLEYNYVAIDDWWSQRHWQVGSMEIPCHTQHIHFPKASKDSSIGPRHGSPFRHRQHSRGRNMRPIPSLTSPRGHRRSRAYFASSVMDWQGCAHEVTERNGCLDL